jgi:hypothetical protein
MTGRYGQKKAPRAVPIGKLNQAIQAIEWPFLRGVAPGNRISLLRKD